MEEGSRKGFSFIVGFFFLFLMSSSLLKLTTTGWLSRKTTKEASIRYEFCTLILGKILLSKNDFREQSNMNLLPHPPSRGIYNFFSLKIGTHICLSGKEKSSRDDFLKILGCWFMTTVSGLQTISTTIVECH